RSRSSQPAVTACQSIRRGFAARFSWHKEWLHHRNDTETLNIQHVFGSTQERYYCRRLVGFHPS
ncbi:MAG: hypothetical protein WCI81_06235, partial [Chlorobiaceae bacterium]